MVLRCSIYSIHMYAESDRAFNLFVINAIKFNETLSAL